jgi:hypothetical protein
MSLTEERAELAVGILSAVPTAAGHVSDFVRETNYRTIDARPNVSIMGRIGIGFGGM